MAPELGGFNEEFFLTDITCPLPVYRYPLYHRYSGTHASDYKSKITIDLELLLRGFVWITSIHLLLVKISHMVMPDFKEA